MHMDHVTGAVAEAIFIITSHLHLRLCIIFMYVELIAKSNVLHPPLVRLMVLSACRHVDGMEFGLHGK